MTHPNGRDRYIRGSAFQRFWPKVRIEGPDDCWEWLGAYSRTGYGGFKYEGRVQLAHRVAWVLTHGPIPEGDGAHGTCVLHRCDDPRCVNPAHLSLGTLAENVADMVSKGRSPKNAGERNPFSKLNDSAVITIRRRRSNGERVSIIAKDFNVTRNVIYDIANGRRWGHVISK